MENKIVVMNFSGACHLEPFVESSGCPVIDCSMLSGVDCYCDADARKELQSMMCGYPAEGIHFIDSGDYHYVSKLWTDRIGEPFSLLLFDHHPDLQQPAFEGVLSCGGWVKDLLDTNPNIRKVIIVGPPEHLIAEIPEHVRTRASFYAEEELLHPDGWERFLQEGIGEPLYISIDKDILRREDAYTNWSQGNLSLEHLEEQLRRIMAQFKVLGADICGEFPCDQSYFEQVEHARVCSRANAVLLQTLKEYL